MVDRETIYRRLQAVARASAQLAVDRYDLATTERERHKHADEARRHYARLGRLYGRLAALHEREAERRGELTPRLPYPADPRD